jgi:hypothetical protein
MRVGVRSRYQLGDALAEKQDAVAAACGWPADLADEAIQKHLLALNQAAAGWEIFDGGVA